MDLRCYFLGQPQIFYNQTAIHLTNAKALALLAYLACHNQPQPRERILGLLWAESSSSAARKNLSNCLWQLRQQLGEGCIRSHDDRLSLGSAVWNDLQALWQLHQPDLQTLLNCYRGPLLDGLNLRDAPEFELWLLYERNRLHQYYLQLLEQALQTTNDQQQKLQLASHSLSVDPLHEPFVQAAIQACLALDQRANALQYYTNFQHQLAQQLGLEPAAATQALRMQILGSPTAPRIQSPRLPTPRNTSKLVGREPDYALLHAAWQRSLHGHVQVVLLTGELGIGKTSLWQTWLGQIREAHQVVVARGLEITQLLPFAPFLAWTDQTALFDWLFGTQSPLSPYWQSELARLIPDFKQREIIPPLSNATPAEERRRIFEAMLQVLLLFADQPLVLVLDDAHWADQLSLGWLGYAAERLQSKSVLIILTYRANQVQGELANLLWHWQRNHIAQRHELQPLSPLESEQLVLQQGGDQQRSVQLYRRSRGNPYFLHELLHAPSDQIPSSLADVLGLRLINLPSAAQALLSAAMILGINSTLELLQQVSHCAEDQALDMLDLLLQQGILVEQAGQYQIAHPLIGEVWQQQLSPARRQVFHRRAAEALAENYAGILPMVAVQLASHYEAAGKAHEAARYAEMAGYHALIMAAGSEAVVLYQRALTLEPTPLRQLGLGRAWVLQGDLVAARTSFNAARQAFELLGDFEGAAQASLQLAASYQ
ncbi:AAA family ATPase [Herpetosiphon gulosus]|uniref:Bacterial transcriptional activator domain-containing protein n=1 Tax=Herpetosiphon gulosus TaxID=1973496 RepID=A0ABP9WUH1_9CHLR